MIASSNGDTIATANVGSFLARQWEAKSAWVTSHSTEIVIGMVVGTLVYFALHFVKSYAAKRTRKVDQSPTEGDDYTLTAIFWRAISKTNEFVIFILALRIVSGVAEAPAFLGRVVTVFFTIAMAFQVAVWVREIILGFVYRKSGDSDHESLANALTIIRLLVSVAVFAIATIVILDNLGVDVTGLVAGLGIGGIAIGLAAQGIFSDLFAALAVIFDKPFKKGEVIGFDGVFATVENIGLKSTRLRSVSGEEVVISNANLLDKRIENFTRLNRRRTRFAIGVIYQTPPEKARRIPEILKEIVTAHDAAFVRAGFIGFGDSSIDFQLDFDIMSTDFEVVFAGRHAIGLDILDRFNREDIEFAYPTQTTFTAAPDGEMIMPYPPGGFLAVAPDT